MEKLKIRIKIEENDEERLQYQEIMIDNEKDLKKYEKLKKRIQKFVKEMKPVKRNEPEITEIIDDMSNDKYEDGNKNNEVNTRNTEQDGNRGREMNMKNTKQ